MDIDFRIYSRDDLYNMLDNLETERDSIIARLSAISGVRNVGINSIFVDRVSNIATILYEDGIREHVALTTPEQLELCIRVERINMMQYYVASELDKRVKDSIDRIKRLTQYSD